MRKYRRLPGGPLELQIYPGKDATFTLVEDDGETTDYLKGQVRRTTFTLQDKTGRLSWKREGPYAGKDASRICTWFCSIRGEKSKPKAR